MTSHASSSQCSPCPCQRSAEGCDGIRSGEESREESREEMQTEDSVDDVCYAGNIVEWRNRFGYWKNAHFYALSNFKIDFVAAIRARGRNEADPMLGYMCDVTFSDGKCLG